MLLPFLQGEGASLAFFSQKRPNSSRELACRTSSNTHICKARKEYDLLRRPLPIPITKGSSLWAAHKEGEEIVSADQHVQDDCKR